ncbi:MAG: CPBP family intramembrane glutamic endopeptidase [Peptococcia bacterium]
MERNIKKTLIFIGLTFFLNYLLVILFFVFGGTWSMPGSLVVPLFYMFIPMLVAIFVQKYLYQEPLRKPLGISFKINRWFFVAWLFPILLAFATLGVSLLLPGVEFSPEMSGMIQKYADLLSPEQIEEMKEQAAALPVHPLWLALLEGLLAGITINAVAGFGEELGWRGFLQKELGYLGFWKSSLLIGLIWGVWHAPLILQGHNYPEHPLAGVLMMTVFTLLFAPLISFVRLKARSVIAAAVMHGTLNGTAGIALIVIKGGNDLLVGVTGLAGFIVLALCNVVLFFWLRHQSRKGIVLSNE